MLGAIEIRWRMGMGIKNEEREWWGVECLATTVRRRKRKGEATEKEGSNGWGWKEEWKEGAHVRSLPHSPARSGSCSSDSESESGSDLAGGLDAWARDLYEWRNRRGCRSPSPSGMESGSGSIELREWRRVVLVQVVGVRPGWSRYLKRDEHESQEIGPDARYTVRPERDHHRGGT
jgi:hypothetical protein